MHRSLSALVSCLALAFTIVGCDGAVPPATPDSVVAPAGGLSSVTLSLTAGGSVHFDQVSYDITGGTFHQTGVIDASHSTTASAYIGGIPLGHGYSITLVATDSIVPATACHGSGTFDVTSETPVPVAVHMSCKEPRAVAAPVPAVPIPPVAKWLVTLSLLAIGMAVIRRRTATR